ncbi:hypothetical protein [Arcobacter sp.]|uniref:hypothetical protein n=1 Tax=Arcobacter sp. TaxID=1872629 RepID=UPI003D118B76
MKDLLKWTFLFFLPYIIAVIFDYMGYPDEAMLIGFLMLPYTAFIIYRMYKFAKEIDDYNNKRF